MLSFANVPPRGTLRLLLSQFPHVLYKAKPIFKCMRADMVEAIVPGTVDVMADDVNDQIAALQPSKVLE